MLTWNRGAKRERVLLYRQKRDLMYNEMIISCHHGPKKARWQESEPGLMLCSVCKSIHPDEFIWSLVNGDGFISGWHWEKGEPSYCETERGRFYSNHLLDMSTEWLYTFALTIFHKTGVLFFWDRERMKYHAAAEGAFFGKGSVMSISDKQFRVADKINKRYWRQR